MSTPQDVLSTAPEEDPPTQELNDLDPEEETDLRNIDDLCSKLKQNEKDLSSLTLSDYRPGVGDFLLVLESLENNSTVTHVNFSSLALEDQDMPALIKLLRKNKNFKALKLCSNHITAVGAAQLADVMPTLKLDNFCICNNPIDSKSPAAFSLVQALKALPMFKTLHDHLTQEFQQSVSPIIPSLLQGQALIDCLVSDPRTQQKLTSEGFVMKDYPLLRECECCAPLRRSGEGLDCRKLMEGVCQNYYQLEGNKEVIFVLASIGTGFFLQEAIYIANLLKAGIRQFHFQAVDEEHRDSKFFFEDNWHYMTFTKAAFQFMSLLYHMGLNVLVPRPQIGESTLLIQEIVYQRFQAVYPAHKKPLGIIYISFFDSIKNYEIYLKSASAVKPELLLSIDLNSDNQETLVNQLKAQLKKGSFHFNLQTRSMKSIQTEFLTPEHQDHKENSEKEAIYASIQRRATQVWDTLVAKQVDRAPSLDDGDKEQVQYLVQDYTTKLSPKKAKKPQSAVPQQNSSSHKKKQKIN